MEWLLVYVFDTVKPVSSDTCVIRFTEFSYVDFHSHLTIFNVFTCTLESVDTLSFLTQKVGLGRSHCIAWEANTEQ